MSRLETTSAPARQTGRSHLARRTTVGAGLSAITVAVALTVTGGVSAAAGPATVGLGTAASFAVLAGSTVTNTGPTVVSGNLGVSPKTAVTGFPPGIVNGVIHAADAVAGDAQAATTTAYDDAAGRPADVTEVTELAGRRLTGGVYSSASSMLLSDTLTLDGGGDPTSVFIFKMGSTLTTASAATVSLVNGASACNVFWQVGSSATLGTGTTFAGNVLALTSITLTTGASVDGRLLARNGAVTLDSNKITAPTCQQATSPTPSVSATATASPPADSPPDSGGTPESTPAPSAAPPASPGTPESTPAPSAAPPASPGTTAPVTTAPGVAPVRATSAPVRATPAPVRVTPAPVRATPARGTPAAAPRTPSAPAPVLARPARPVRAPAHFTG